MRNIIEELGIPFRNIPSNEECLEELMNDIRLALGEGMIDIELDPEHIHLAIKRTLDRYRTRSRNAAEESFLVLELQPDVSEYTLPAEVMEVYNVYRRGTSGNTPYGTYFDPFVAAVVNVLYSVPRSGVTGDIATYDLAMQHREMLGRIFGRELLYTWKKAERKIVFHRTFKFPEDVILHVYNYKPLNILLSEPESRQWIRDYAIAMSKYILGEARSFMSNIPGPGGGITLNGDALKTEAKEEMERLEEELKTQIDSDEGYWFIIG